MLDIYMQRYFTKAKNEIMKIHDYEIAKISYCNIEDANRDFFIFLIPNLSFFCLICFTGLIKV